MSLVKAKYRPDIDGLRAVAVMAVILYHFNPVLLPGGFAGVDIFFVISGYLITANILSGINTNSFSIYEFYNRRALRILPNLFFCGYFYAYCCSFHISAERLFGLELLGAGVGFVSGQYLLYIFSGYELFCSRYRSATFAPYLELGGGRAILSVLAANPVAGLSIYKKYKINRRDCFSALLHFVLVC